MKILFLKVFLLLLFLLKFETKKSWKKMSQRGFPVGPLLVLSQLLSVVFVFAADVKKPLTRNELRSKYGQGNN